MRTLEIMNSNASSDIQGIVTDLLNSRPYSHRQDADSSVAAVITAQSDLRFFSSTFAAVLAQRVLPGTIIVADCTNQVEQPMQMTFSVIPSPAGVLTEVPESKTIRVILVGVKGASSFMNAVARAMQQIDLDDRVGALWTLHDDSRPADESCLEVLLDAWKNTPTASLLGAKQLDWQAESLHNVGLYAGHHNVTSLVVDGEPDQEQYDGRQDVLAVSLGRVPIHGSARSPNPRTCAGASAWAVAVWWWSRRRESPIGGQDLKACVPKTANLLKMRKAASIRILRYARRIRNTRIRTCIVLGGRCCGSGRY